MRNECIDAVQQAIGRGLTRAEVKGIEGRIRDTMRRMAREDAQGWRSMSEADRLTEAAKRAAEELVGEAEKKQQRLVLRIASLGRTLQFVEDAKAAGARGMDGMLHHLEQTDIHAKGVRQQYFTGLVDAMQAINGRLLGMIENAEVARAVTREIFGVDSGSKVAKQAAKAWLDTIESMRLRFNAAGGDVGKLDYGYIPQPHDAVAVQAAGADRWAAEVLPLLDRGQYFHEDGRAFTDADLTGFLKSAWDSIASDGLNKLEPGQHRGAGMLANRGSQSRQIHFAGPDEYLAYMQAYGQRGVLASMQAHVGALARNIALVERMGPNPELTFRTVVDTLRKEGESTRVAGKVVDIESVWATTTNQVNQARWARLADVAQGVRNLQVAAKLGSATLSSITDLGTLALTARFHRLPVLHTAANVVRAFGKKDTEFANRAGLIAESMISDMNRWGEGNIGPGWTSKLSAATMKLSLMNYWTDSLRRGFSVTMMGALGKMSRGEWGKLDAADRAHMQRAGVTEADFAVWKLATPEDWRGSSMLTPESIKAIPDEALAELGTPARVRDQAITKLLAYITDEAEYAVVNPDLLTRTIQSGGTLKGTATGEIWRSIMLFKSFPIAMITRHWRRTLDDSMTTGQRLAYGASLMTGLTALGYVALTAKDLRDGRDPRDVTDPKVWGAAFTQGGGVGIVGDFLFSDVSRFGDSLTETLAGPVAGTFSDLARLTIGNVHQAGRGEDTHAGAEAVRFLRSQTPMVNLWYTKAALERAFLHDLQEAMSPGYLRRMERRARQEWGQQFWWQPGELTPERAPDFGAMVGE
ncbi:MAG TPA: hypothetical protein VGE10_11155 [Zeimonas sp.]